MSWLRTLRKRPWLAVSAAVIGLLVMIAITGLAGLALNARVSTLTSRTLDYDIELEDRGNELLLAVLEVRHRHRNMIFARSLSQRMVAEFEGAYAELLAQIDQFDELGALERELPQTDQLRAMAQDYYAIFRPDIDLHDSDPTALTAGSDEGLVKLDALECAAQQISRTGEQRGEAALLSLKQAATSARVVQIAVLAGLVLVGGGLAYTTVRTAREQQETAQRLAHALQAKSDFIADASHELRTPLTVLRGNAEVALELDRTCVHVELLEEIVE